MAIYGDTNSAVIPFHPPSINSNNCLSLMGKVNQITLTNCNYLHWSLLMLSPSAWPYGLMEHLWMCMLDYSYLVLHITTCASVGKYQYVGQPNSMAEHKWISMCDTASLTPLFLLKAFQISIFQICVAIYRLSELKADLNTVEWTWWFR